MTKNFLKIRSEILGLIWLAISIFLLFSLLSFSPKDQSLFGATGATQAILNACGHVGAVLSELLFKLFGLASYLLVFFTGNLSVQAFRKESISPDKYGWSFIILCLVAVSFSLYTDFSIFNGEVKQGGWIGYALAKNALAVFNFTGATIVIGFLYLSCFFLMTEDPIESLKHLFSKLNLINNRAGEEETEEEVVETSFFKRFLFGPLEAFRGLFLRSGTQDQFEGEFEEHYNEDENEDIDDEEEELESAVPLSPVVKRALRRRKKEKEDSFKIESFKRDKIKAIHRKIKDSDWEMPSIDLLNEPPGLFEGMSEVEIREKSNLLTSKLEQFNVRGKIVGVKSGPAVTLFEFRPNADIKISKITELADDLCLALSSESVRIIAPIPGRDVVGIETSNSKRDTVFIKDILSMDNFWKEETKIPVGLGRRADGYPMIVDLRTMPHLLVAGSTGSGKSVFVVSMITGLLLRHSPKKLKLILVDPKQVDLAAFNDLPHLLIPPVKDTKKAVNALRWAINEMDKRYRSMSKFKVRDLENFNLKVEAFDQDQMDQHKQINEEIDVEAPMKSYYYSSLPYIVIIVEEFGDLMAVDKANVEHAVVRLAQMARACGIHLVLAMQSPRKDVVTGLIKTNIPGRISFKVASKMDSRVILDESGAERLLSKGDMLFQSPGILKPVRALGAYVSEEEIERITDVWKKQSEPIYDERAMRAIDGGASSDGAGQLGGPDESEDFDDRYDEILEQISEMKDVSASMLQRKFRLGYPRAARLIEIFEQQGVVGPANGSKPRKVLINTLKDL